MFVCVNRDTSLKFESVHACSVFKVLTKYFRDLVVMAIEGELFTQQMKKATKEIHAISDALVNAKLAFALSSDTVWADGLLVFYEVFRYLENAMARHSDSLIGELCVEGMVRTEAFEKDLDFYLKPGWKTNYIPRESVTKYLEYLQKIEDENPELLMAYIYHLYMGLLSGGQILKRKRELFNKILGNVKEEGNAVTDFGNLKIYKIKRELVAAMNSVACKLDEETKEKLIDESKTVFLLNNELIKSVQGANTVVMKKFFVAAVIVIPIAWVIYRIYF